MSAGDTDGTIVSWELDIDNDGSAEYSGAGNPPATQQHTYTGIGSYTAELTVWDDDGAPGFDTATVAVNEPPNQPPTAVLVADPVAGIEPLPVAFTMTGDDLDGTVSSWDLDIDNDGSPEYSGAGNPPATQQHTYNDPGTYTAELTVWDDDGAPGYDTAVVTVQENTVPLLNNGAVSPDYGYYGTRFEFRVDYFDADGHGPSLIQVNIDGTDYDMTLDSGTPENGTYQYRTRDISQNISHTYYFHAEDGHEGSARMPSSGTISGPATFDPDLFLSGTPGPGAWLTVEMWGAVDALWGVAWSREPGPFYLPASGLTYDVGPANLHLVKKMGEDPLHLDEYGYGAKDFQLPDHVSSGTKYIQGTTKMNAFWAKTGQGTFVVP